MSRRDMMRFMFYGTCGAAVTLAILIAERHIGWSMLLIAATWVCISRAERR